MGSKGRERVESLMMLSEGCDKRAFVIKDVKA